jgi:hypothetical protein
LEDKYATNTDPRGLIMSKQTEILAEREGSSMASAWTEYLCLRIVQGGPHQLFQAQYEPLGECEGYFNEETQEYELPDEINGQPVVGMEDEWVVGGSLEPFQEELAMEFTSVDEPKVASWLKAYGWSDLISLETIKRKFPG